MREHATRDESIDRNTVPCRIDFSCFIFDILLESLVLGLWRFAMLVRGRKLSKEISRANKQLESYERVDNEKGYEVQCLIF